MEYTLASGYAALGEADLAFQWLDSAIVARRQYSGFLYIDPNWDSFRSDPRYQAALERRGFK